MHSSKKVSRELSLLTYLSSKHILMHIKPFLYQQGMTHPESSSPLQLTHTQTAP